MKKLILVLALVALATPVFAVDISGATGTSIGSALFKPSKSVTVSYTAATATYGAGAKHTAGNKGYGTTNADSRITEFTCTEGYTKTTGFSATAAATSCVQ